MTPLLLCEEPARYLAGGQPCARRRGSPSENSGVQRPASNVQHRPGSGRTSARLASDLQPPASPTPSVTHLTEAQLTEIWRGRRFPEGALVTRAGVPVTVVYQGRPGRGPGPDFRAAVIRGPSGLTLRGDVELHVRSSSFRSHGHAADPAYANIVLHVVFDDDTGVDTPLFGGRTAPVVALAPWVARRAGELRRWLERPLLWREPCHGAVERIGAEATGAALDAEGDRRFNARAERFRQRIGVVGLDQALYEALLEALGYGGNSAAMLALAQLLPWRVLNEVAPMTDAAFAAIGVKVDAGGWTTDASAPLAEADLRPATNDVRPERRQAFEALLLGAAGLLPSQRGYRGDAGPYVRRLEAAFAASGLPSLGPATWKLWGVRPANAAPRRIAAAASLLAALGSPSALVRLAAAASVREALAPLLRRAEAYWLTQYDTCAAACALPPAFIGRSRALEVLQNVVLPAAVASGDAALAGNAHAIFARLPRPSSYGVTRFLENALRSPGSALPLNARRAQGLLALHRDWCTQGGCGRCPLSG